MKPAKRNPVARALQAPHLRPKVKPSGKTYSRKRKDAKQLNNE